MSQDTKVRVLRGDAPCNACAMQIERAIAAGHEPTECTMSPHSASFLLQRETFGGLLILTTACERAVAEELHAIDAAAYPTADSSAPVPV